jgi:hypothetical protein
LTYDITGQPRAWKIQYLWEFNINYLNSFVEEYRKH